MSIMTWSYSVLKPRIMEVECWNRTDATSLWRFPTPSNAIIPYNLHTCRKSRGEARRIYHQLISGTWMNFSVDTLYLRLPTLNNEEDIVTMFSTDSPLRGLHFFALWKYSWHLLSLEELFIISNDDGLSTETESTNNWNEGSKTSFWILQDTRPSLLGREVIETI